MLTLEQIKEYFSAGSARSNLKGILTEYLQYEFLDSLFKLSGSEHLSFIGGTAIRILYNSQRFSEDLDFDNLGLDYSKFKRLINEACRELQVKGFKIELRFISKNATAHAYLKFPGILKQFGIPAHHQEKIFLSIDAEKKESLYKPEVRAINKFGIFRNVPAASTSILLAKKLIAILLRKREKGRDFYDVSFLSGLAKPDHVFIHKTTKLSGEEFKQRLINRCAKFNYKLLLKDVSPFLFNEEQKERILSFPALIEEIL